jgi:predicted nuclease of predicted toxin-antitoxin system
VKFLVDNQLPAALARWLVSRGQEAVHVLDIGLAKSTDEEIWKYASANSLVLITKDDDFSRRSIRAQAEVPVVWVRLGNCRKATLLAAFDVLMADLVAALESGARLIEIR